MLTQRRDISGVCPSPEQMKLMTLLIFVFLSIHLIPLIQLYKVPKLQIGEVEDWSRWSGTERCLIERYHEQI